MRKITHVPSPEIMGKSKLPHPSPGDEKVMSITKNMPVKEVLAFGPLCDGYVLITTCRLRRNDFPCVGMDIFVFSLTWRVRIYTFWYNLNFIKTTIFLLRFRYDKFNICLKQKQKWFLIMIYLVQFYKVSQWCWHIL